MNLRSFMVKNKPGAITAAGLIISMKILKMLHQQIPVSPGFSRFACRQ